MSIALGGCLRGEPHYGITEDTGGHITYVLGAMRALAARDDTGHCEIVTRLFDEPDLGRIHAAKREQLSAKLAITRIDSGVRRYLSKEALAQDRAAFTQALIARLRGRSELPDCLHAHFADAAQVACAVRDALGIPFIYTPHSLAKDKLDQACASDPGLAARIAEEDRAIGAADAIVASSRDECERQLLAYPSARQERICRIRPGISHRGASPGDIAAARELIAPFLRTPARPLILAIARPVKKKNLAALVRAYAESADLRRRANLVLLPGLRGSVSQGEPEQVAVMQELVDLIDRHDLHGSIAYPRRHDQSGVRGMYALAARSGGVFVNAAKFEPFGLTLLEAAVHGLPVVATSRGGPADIVAEIGHGTLVDPDDTGALGRAIGELLDDRARWNAASDAARRNIAEVTWEGYAAHFVKVAHRLRAAPAAAQPFSQPDKLLLCDIDNTLTGCRASARRLARYLARRPGLAFGVATGRSLTEARRLLDEWELPPPLVWITSVGTEIFWADKGRLRQDDAFAAHLGRQWESAAVDEIMRPQSVAIPQPGIEQRAFKRSYFLHDRGALAGLRDSFTKARVPARIVFSHDRLLDILPISGGKGAAMRHVAKVLSLAPEQVIVAGDSGNDSDMIAACPNAILVANCESALRTVGEQKGAYVARRRFAGGVLEGLIAHEWRDRARLRTT